MFIKPLLRSATGLLILSLLSTNLSMSCASSEVYHMKPSPADECPAEAKHCLTLSQFADQSSSYLELNTTLVLLSGNHSLGSVLSVSNISTFSIRSNSSTIACTNLGRFEYSNILIVQISNVTFVGCAGNKLESVTKFTLEDSSFIGADGDSITGTALELVNTTASIYRNTFFGNRGKLHSVPYLSYVYPNRTTQISAGGAIISTNSNVNITDSCFERNSAGTGGAMFVEAQSNITMINSTFSGNFVNRPDRAYAYIYVSGGGVMNAVDGGSVTIYDCHFINNSAVDGTGGGVLSVSRNVSVYINDSQFHGNSVLGLIGFQGGGVLYAVESVGITINNSQFSTNTGDHFGGVAQVHLYSNLIISHSHFFNIPCRGGLGIVLYISDYANLTITHSQFVKNKSCISGGPRNGHGIMYASNEVNVAIDHSNFSNITFGVIQLNQYVSITINNSRFVNNSDSFGAVIYSAYYNNAVITNSEFIGNSARLGGVMLVQGYNLINPLKIDMAFVTISDCYFFNNTATIYGGVMYIEHDVNVTITGSRFVNNRGLDHKSSGAVIMVRANVALTIVRSEFINNSATVDDKFRAVSGQEDKEHYGGGIIYADYDVNVTIANSCFVSNTAASGDGGVIFSGYLYNSVDAYNIGISVTKYKESHVVIVITNNLFDSNSALGKHGGGVIYAVSAVRREIVITNNTFTNNHAVSGGVMTVVGNFNITIADNNVFINNTAKNGGVLAAVGNVSYHNVYASNQIEFINLYASGEYATVPGSLDIHITQNDFITNRALGDYGGGVVYVGSNVDMVMSGNQFTNNSAMSSSGGVLWLADNKVSVSFSTFVDNTANNGGSIYMNGVYIYVNNSSFESSLANKDGGVLYAEHSTAKIVGTTFSDNTANKSGGIMFAKEGMNVLDNCNIHNNKAGHDGGVITSQEGNVTVYESHCRNNTASHDGGVIALQYGDVNIHESSFDLNSAGNDGGVIHVYQGTMNSTNCIYQGNTAFNDGGVVDLFQSTMRIMECSFTSNKAINDGGAVSAYQGILHMFEDSRFSSNRAQNDGGVIHAFELHATIKGNIYDGNSAGNKGGVWFAYQGSLEIFQSVMSHSEAPDGGVIYAEQVNVTLANVSCLRNKAEQGGSLHIDQSMISINHSSFGYNFAERFGGSWFLEGCQAMLEDVSFKQNSANRGGAAYFSISSVSLVSAKFLQNLAYAAGGALYSSQSEIISLDNMLIMANKASLGVVYMLGSTAHLSGLTSVLDNVGSFLLFNSMAIFSGMSKFHGSSEPLKLHATSVVEVQEGGALTLSKSDVIFNGTSILTNNRAEMGGAIHATESKLYVNGDVSIAYNTANDTGGGVYLDMSEVECQGNSSLELLSNVAGEQGGGIHAISSTINIVGNFNANNNESIAYFGSFVNFTNNKGKRGGGLCLEMNTKLYILKSAPSDEPFPIVTFTGNSADYGGAIYVSDDSNLGMCNPSYSSHYKAKECFFQVLATYSSSAPFNYSHGSMSISTQNVFFSHNVAYVSGLSLYGGLIDRCKLHHFSELQNITSINVLQSGYGDKIVNGISYMTNISNVNVSEINSRPVQLCFCRSNIPDCNYQPDPRRVIKGKKFVVEVVAVDQVNHLTSANVHSFLYQTGGGFGSGQTIQNVSETCTELTFNLFSPNDEEELIMNVEGGPCESSPLSQRRLSIEFTACNSCPLGFERHTDNTSCQCVCDSRLKPYITKCNATTKRLERKGDFWITYINTGDNATSGYLVYAHCPLNYCEPPTTKVEINLNILDGANVQCANGHSGMLCGSCRSNYSLSLGSSRCIVCSTNWPTIVVILVAAILAGIALVMLLLVLNLTVSVGTLNGIVLYANLVATSGRAFLPFSRPNFATVFISWLNLEVGFDVCFFEGMDAFWKTLLQLAFPMYVIFLVIIVIFISEHSTKVAQLVAKKNPVAVLATLILLSYTKFLNTVIISISYATLVYPDSSQRVMWLADASVEYLSGKHIVLFIIAILILLAGVIYTTLLFSWQWLVRYQDKKVFKWMGHQKLCHFIDTYHAPYTFEQRYWTGLLLYVRVILYIISTLNYNGALQVSLISTVIIVGFLPLLKGILERKIYKEWLKDITEFIVYFNIISFAAITLKTGTTKNQPVVAFISVTITAALLLVVIVFHLFWYTRLLSLVKMVKAVFVKLAESRNMHHSECTGVPTTDDDDLPLITHSVIEIP